jgi:hypothetical protein
MRKIQIAGLQRSGTNYLEWLIRLNSSDNVKVLSGIFLPHALDKTNANRGFWKHSIEVPSNGIDRYIDQVLMIYKTPINWIESIAFRDGMDFDVTQKKFDVYHRSEDARYIGPQNFNLLSLIQTYNYHYENWILTPNLFSEKIISVIYEELLNETGIRDFFKKANLSCKETLKIPPMGTIPWSNKQYHYEPDYLDRYKQNNCSQSLISKSDRQFIFRNLHPEIVKKFYIENNFNSTI